MTQENKTFKRSRFIWVPFILLAGVMVLLFWQVDRLIALSNWVDHTDQVIAKINLFEEKIVDLETGIRGFALTGDSSFLEPYQQSDLKLPQAIEGFRKLVQDCPEQGERIDRVVALLNDWEQYAQNVIGVKKSRGDVTPLVKSKQGKTIFDSIRTQLEEMRATEEQLKAKRISSVHLASKRLYWVLLISFIVLTLGLVRNLMERLGWETALQKSEELFRLMVEGTRDYAICMLDTKGYIKSWNAMARHLYGHPSDEVIGKHFSIFLLPEPLKEEKSEAELMRAIREGRVEDEGWRVRKDGSRFWANVTISALFGSDDKLKGFVKISRDLTEKKRIEDEFRDSMEKYRTIIATAYDGIVTVNEQGKIESTNQRVENMFGYSSNELLNQPLEVLVPDRFKDIHVVHRAHYVTNPTARKMGANLDLHGKRKDGTEFPLDISLSPIKTEKGTQVTVIVRDISERREIERVRTRLLLKERSANLAKDEFLSTLSHELRTPLTTILSWSQLLRSGKLDAEKTRRGLEILEQSAKAQGQLIDDLLDISRIQAGKLSLAIQKIDPARVIAAAIDSTRSMAANKSMQIETTIDPSIKYIFADPTRLQQILWNLITNSIKFSSWGGRIWINLKRTMSSSGEHFQFEVRDNGKGIKPDSLRIIFERFTQVDSSSTRSYGGLGLGLSIVQKLVEMQEGTVRAESVGEGKGATFIVSLPAAPTAKNYVAEAAAEATAEAEAKAEAETEVTLSGLRVLLVDDEADAREVFSVMLKSFGAEVKTAESVSEALAIFADFKPDVLVSDIAMPIEDGYSLISKIRAQKSKLGRTPALALTAYAGQEDIQRVHLSGFQGHLAKPVDAHKLALAISRVAGQKAS